MARPTIHPAALVISVTDTQSESLMPPEPQVSAYPQGNAPAVPQVDPQVAPQVAAPGAANLGWAIPLAAIGMVAILLVVVSAILPSTLVASKDRCTKLDAAGACSNDVNEAIEFGIVPATADPVNPRLMITGVPQYSTDGDIHFVTVRSPKLSMLDWWATRSNPAVSFQSYVDKFGDETPAQQRQRGAQAMRTAKETAEYVALKRVGLPAELVPGDVIIDGLVCLQADAAGTTCTRFAPSDLVLNPGDKLLELGGKKLSTIDDLTGALAGYKPGDMVEVIFERDGKQMTDKIELIASPDDASRIIVGFYPSDTSSIKLPDEIGINIDTDTVGGPSAGLAFTMTLIDELTQGNLLGGADVAITGTININGEVGAIGGLSSKASAVMQIGVKYFLVPTSQGPEDIAKARLVVGNQVEIIPVATVDEALAALQRIGGDPLVIPPGGIVIG